jgi:hypothetical protein
MHTYTRPNSITLVQCYYHASHRTELTDGQPGTFSYMKVWRGTMIFRAVPWNISRLQFLEHHLASYVIVTYHWIQLEYCIVPRCVDNDIHSYAICSQIAHHPVLTNGIGTHDGPKSHSAHLKVVARHGAPPVAFQMKSSHAHNCVDSRSRAFLIKLLRCVELSIQTCIPRSC